MPYDEERITMIRDLAYVLEIAGRFRTDEGFRRNPRRDPAAADHEEGRGAVRILGLDDVERQRHARLVAINHIWRDFVGIICECGN